MSRRRRNPPCQRSLPLDDWPSADRMAWLAAQETAGILDDGGIASHLSALTRADLTKRYARFLDYLAARNRLVLHAPPAASVTPDNVLDYVQFLEPRASSVTLSQSVYKIARVARYVDPERDWDWLQRVVRRLGLRARPQDRRGDVVEIAELYRLGRQLMHRAETALRATNFQRAMLYRDGLVIALLSTDPLRRTNIAELEIGTTLVKDGSWWSFHIEAEQMKARRPHIVVLPDWASACIDRYLDHYRPHFRNAAMTARLWISRKGRPLHGSSLAQMVSNRTLKAFGKPICPHLVRSCLATSTAVHHGDRIGLAMTVLEHRSHKVTETYYIQAEMVGALRDYHAKFFDDPQ